MRVLAATANMDVHVAIDHLRWVIQTGLMEQPSPERWAFLHVLVRDAIEKTLPALAKARLITEPVSASGTFNSGQNGQITAALILGADLAPPEDFSCPRGQDTELASVSYTDISVIDVTNDVILELGDTVTGCLLPTVRNAC